MFIGIDGKSPQPMLWLLVLVFALSFAQPAQARRVALVIGNGSYENLKVLPNARNDADAVAERLVALGFEVIRPGGGSVAHRDLGLKEFLEAEARFRESARGAEIAFLYYAGHGMQLGDRGDAYLLPVDAALPRSATDFLLLERQSVALDEVLAGLDGLARLTVAVFDACREIPELETATRSIAGASSFRGLSRPKTPGRNRVVAFSAAAGQLAEDGAGRHSPYTAALLEELELRPDREVADLFRAVAHEVGQGRAQQPEVLIQGVPPGMYYFREPRAQGIQVAGGMDHRALLEECSAHEEAKRLTSGAAGNALDCYREVLSLKRGDAEALSGIERIESAYADTAREALESGDVETARRSLDQLRRLNAEHPRLGPLLDELSALGSPVPGTTRLTVRASPSSSRVRILNIAPPYKSGIELEPGRYELEVSAQGYATYRKWHDLAAGEEILDIALTARRSDAMEPELVRVRGGCYEMGSPSRESGRDDDERQHRVCVEDFQMGKHEVTVAEFGKFVSATGYRTDAEKNANDWQGCRSIDHDADKKWDWRSGRNWRNANKHQSNRDDHPVSCVSWNDAMAYIEWLNRETGGGYRLPTEAEWEYAARGGTTTARYWGEDANAACAYANVADRTKLANGNSWSTKHECSDGHAYVAPVGSYRANGYGLHDMLGNVWEWTCSEYDEGYGGAETRCASRGSDARRALRGGSWDVRPDWVRSANRLRGHPANRHDIFGFRLSRTN